MPCSSYEFAEKLKQQAQDAKDAEDELNMLAELDAIVKNW